MAHCVSPGEYPINLRVELMRPGDHGSIDQKKLAPEPMRQSAADSGLSGSRRTRQQYSAFRFQAEFSRQLAILKRKCDFGLQRLNQVIHALQVTPRHSTSRAR